MAEELDRETGAYLARIRKTIEKSNRLVEEVGLRIRETDRMLEQQGLTREQVMAMHFSEAQIEAANEELKRRGLDPLERWELEENLSRQASEFDSSVSPSPEDASSNAELAERQRKFGMMMKPFQI